MKKLFTLAIALLMVFGLAVPVYAITYTVDNTVRENDDLGTTIKTVLGTIAFDSDYPCDNSVGGTSQCGEDLSPTQLGMTTIAQMFIESEHIEGAASLMSFDYDATFLTGSGGTGGIRANFSDVSAGSGASASYPSVPTYDLSALTAIPYLAIGT